ncbi:MULTISPECIES: phosphotransferase [Prauserella]|uniref:phosphotransferase n=1 Tax=Prauserella TaxID=142577 RepID=UPI001FE94B38|nr:MULTISPECIES: phosphotransferase [Prauserella]
MRDTLGVDLHIRRWETIHNDLHWNNLLAPELGILDWEFWGRGPAGTDAASLYCYSLLVPDVARRVWRTFGTVLDTDDGQRALLWVAARLLHRATKLGDHPALITPLHELTAPLLRSGGA